MNINIGVGFESILNNNNLMDNLFIFDCLNVCMQSVTFNAEGE